MAQFDDLSYEVIRQTIINLRESPQTRYAVFNMMRANRRLRDIVIEVILKQDTSNWTEDERKAGLQKAQSIEKTSIRNDIRRLRREKRRVRGKVRSIRSDYWAFEETEARFERLVEAAQDLNQQMQRLRGPFVKRWKKRQSKEILKQGQARTVKQIGQMLHEMMRIGGNWSWCVRSLRRE